MAEELARWGERRGLCLSLNTAPVSDIQGFAAAAADGGVVGSEWLVWTLKPQGQHGANDASLGR